MLKRLVYVALLVSDQDKALDFYPNVVGFEKRGDYATPVGPRFLTIGVKGQDFELVLWPGTPGKASAGSAVYTSGSCQRPYVPRSLRIAAGRGRCSPWPQLRWASSSA